MSLTEAQEIQWLIDNPSFAERPASIREFVGPRYLNLQDNIRPGIMKALVDVFGDQVNAGTISVKRKAVFSGAIGVGKTTYASIALCYMVHWTYCLKDPQKFFDLMPGSRIAFMMMSTSERQAKEVLFGDVKARIEHSPWFQKFCQYDRGIKNQFRFDKDLWIVPGGSEETRFEGYNVLAAIVDEGDCVDDKTEILTSQGWKDYLSLSPGDEIMTLNHETGMSEWQPCEEVRVFEPGPREVLRMEGKEFSSLSTMNHRWPVIRPRKRLGKMEMDRVWTTSEEFGFRDRILRAAPPGDAPELPTHSDALVEMVAWFYTEGNDQCGDGKTVYIYQSPKNAENCDRIRAALAALFGDPVDSFPRQGRRHDGVPRWREKMRSRGGKWGDCVQFVLSTEAGRTLQQYAPDRVPTFDFLRSLTRSQLEIFIEVSLLGDNNGERRFAQKSRAQAEAYAFACTLSGRPVSIRPYEPTVTCPSVMWGVYSAKKDHHAPLLAAWYAEQRNAPDGMRVTREVHDGIVWCPRVKNGSWMARREGTVYFTGNSHKQTDRKDYAEEGFNTLYSRIDSRFPDTVNDTHRGLIMVIGQMKSATGFMNRIFGEFQDDPNGSSFRLTIWEAFGWHRYTENPKDATDGRETAPRKSFVYDIQRKKVISKDDAVERGLDFSGADAGYIEVPTTYLTAFRRNPVKALRDLAGIPPQSTDPFIALPERIDRCQDLWHERCGDESPVTDSPSNPQFKPWFRAPDQMKRVAHVDIATSGDGDAMGIAIAHIPGIVEVDGEEKPLIVFDALMRIHAPSGSEIMLSDMRRILYRLRDDLGFNLKMVTFDGFQSTDSLQLLRKSRIATDYVSVDRSKQPYEDLREGIYDERILFPRYLTALNEVDTDLINIAYQELSQLTDTGPKIDHPPKGSKDIADAMAGCVSTLMQMPQWRRGAPLIRQNSDAESASEVVSDEWTIGQALDKAAVPSPLAERVPSFDEFIGRTDKSSPGMEMVDRGKSSLPFVGSAASVPSDPLSGIA